LKTRHFVQQPHAKAAQFRFDRDRHGRGTGTTPSYVCVLDIRVNLDEDMIDQTREERTPTLSRSEEGREATTMEEKDGVDDVLRVWVGRLKEHTNVSQRERKKDGLWPTYMQSVIQENLTHTFGMKGEEF
jgi:hypothetical protein